MRERIFLDVGCKFLFGLCVAYLYCILRILSGFVSVFFVWFVDCVHILLFEVLFFDKFKLVVCLWLLDW